MSIVLHPAAELFPALSDDEYASLYASIEEVGVLVPVVVDREGRIVDGRHRAEIAEALGLGYTSETLPAGVTPWQYAAGVNLARRNLDEQQRVALLLLAEQAGLAPEVETIRKEAKERHGHGQTAPGKRSDSAEDKRPRSSDQIGALVEVSGNTVLRVQTAEKVKPGSLGPISRGETTAQQVIAAATKKGVDAIAKASGTPPAFRKWREAYRAIDGNVDGATIAAGAERLTAKEIDLIRDATPRLIAALESFCEAATSPRMDVIEGGRR